MTLRLGCIADDYTGASDVANAISQAGLCTIQTIGVPDPSLATGDIDAVVVALKSRSITAEDAVMKSRRADRWLRDAGADHVLFKICSTFDSTDAGNIGAVMDALRADSGDDIVVVCPAFPETGRTVYQGNLFVGDLPLSESPMKDHPLNPMTDSNLVRVLGRQSASRVGLINLATVMAGADAIRHRMAALVAAGSSVAIADAVRDDDLDAISQAALDARVSVGASGLGRALASSLRRDAGSQKIGFFDNPPAMGPTLCVAGSCSTATRQQIAIAETKIPLLRLDVEKLLAGNEAIGDAVSWAADHMHHGAVLISSSAPPEVVAAVSSRHRGKNVGIEIEQRLATIASELVNRGIRRLVIAGGETSGAVVDRLAVPAFLVGPEIAAGVPILRSVGWTGGDAFFALKSGNFGKATFFDDAIRAMFPAGS